MLKEAIFNATTLFFTASFTPSSSYTETITPKDFLLQKSKIFS